MIEHIALVDRLTASVLSGTLAREEHRALARHERAVAALREEHERALRRVREKGLARQPDDGEHAGTLEEPAPDRDVRGAVRLVVREDDPEATARLEEVERSLEKEDIAFGRSNELRDLEAARGGASCKRRVRRDDVGRRRLRPKAVAAQDRLGRCATGEREEPRDANRTKVDVEALCADAFPIGPCMREKRAGATRGIDDQLAALRRERVDDEIDDMTRREELALVGFRDARHERLEHRIEHRNALLAGECAAKERIDLGDELVGHGELGHDVERRPTRRDVRDRRPERRDTRAFARSVEPGGGEREDKLERVFPARRDNDLFHMAEDAGGADARPVSLRHRREANSSRWAVSCVKLASMEPILDLDRAWGTRAAGPQLRRVRRSADALRARLTDGPRVISVRTFPLLTLPYPTRYAFAGAALSPAPYVARTRRCVLVQFFDHGELRNLLFNPTDVAAVRTAPFYERLTAKVGETVAGLLDKTFDTLEQQLAHVGLVPDDIDYVAFDAFQLEDLRGLATRFPGARLLAPEVAWTDWDDLHPLQRAWYVREGKDGVGNENVVFTNGDLALGDGVMLLRTPGRAVGNQTLLLHTSAGVWGVSANGACADSWSPLESKIRGLAASCQRLDVDVLPDASTPHEGALLYTSMILERALADRVHRAPAFVQMLPSREVTPNLLAPGLTPTIVHGAITDGSVARPRARTTA